MIRPIKHYTAGDVREQSYELGMGIDEDQLEEYARLLNVMVDALGPVDRNQGRTSSLSTASGNIHRSIEDVSEEERAATRPVERGRALGLGQVERSGGQRTGPLAGMRMGLKDNIAVAGVPMTCASRILQGFVPTIDADRYATTCRGRRRDRRDPEYGEHGLLGRRRVEPLRPDLEPVRSKAVSRAALPAARARVLAYPWIDANIGGDQGGSIRIPAAWCGVIGHKPTHSLVPYTGAVGIDKTIDHLGPMTRTVKDAAQILRVISGPDPSDPRQLDAQRTKATHADLDALLKGEPRPEPQGS